MLPPQKARDSTPQGILSCEASVCSGVHGIQQRYCNNNHCHQKVGQRSHHLQSLLARPDELEYFDLEV